MTWEEHKYGMTTLCNKCKGRIESLHIKDYKRLFAFVSVTRTESFVVEWACMVDGCPTMEIQEGTYIKPQTGTGLLKQSPQVLLTGSSISMYAQIAAMYDARRACKATTATIARPVLADITD